MTAPVLTFTASTTCAVAGVLPATLRAWRTKNGLLLTAPRSKAWHRFSVADVCLVRLVAQLTSRDSEMNAQHAVDAAMMLRPAFVELTEGEPEHPQHYAIVGKYYGDTGSDAARIELVVCHGAETLAEAVTRRGGWEAATIVDLGAIIEHVIAQLKELEGE